MKPLHTRELYFPGAEASQGAEGLLPAWERSALARQGEREWEAGDVTHVWTCVSQPSLMLLFQFQQVALGPNSLDQPDCPLEGCQ